MIVEEWSFAFWMMTIKGPLIMEDHAYIIVTTIIVVMHEDECGKVMMMIREDHNNDDGRSG